MYHEDSFTHDLFVSVVGSEKSRGWKSFLDNKKDMAKTQFGIGLASKIPALQKDESIFIATSKMFPNAHERLIDVKKVLESNGHICEVKSEGKVSLVEIDNILYELIPDAVGVRIMNIHGVRLRRYLV